MNFPFLDNKSIAALRNARGLNRFVYMSCAPKASEKNWIDLARPCSKTLKGEPFVITKAVGVDMFPHTEHKEMILLFERVLDVKKDVAVTSDTTAATAVDDNKCKTEELV